MRIISKKNHKKISVKRNLSFGETISFVKMVCITFENNTLKEKYVLSFEGLTFGKPDIVRTQEDAKQLRKEKPEHTIRGLNVLETTDILFIQLETGATTYLAVYNKFTDESCLMSMFEFYDALGLQSIVVPVGVCGDEIIGFISPGNMKIKGESEITNPALAAIVKDLKEDDNPILCFFKIKHTGQR